MPSLVERATMNSEPNAEHTNWRVWLLTDTPAFPRQAALGRAVFWMQPKAIHADKTRPEPPVDFAVSSKFLESVPASVVETTRISSILCVAVRFRTLG